MTQVLQVKEVDIPTFLRKKHDLDPLLKEFTKAARDALEVLISISNDLTNEAKVRMQAADKILEHTGALSDQVNKDKLHRLVAEIKLRIPLGLPKTLEVEEEDNTPLVDFSTIRTIE